MATKERKTDYHGEYSWIMKPKLLNRMINAVNGQDFLSEEFKIGSMEGQIKAFPNGKDEKDIGQFMVKILLSSFPINIGNISFGTRIHCNELGIRYSKRYSGLDFGIYKCDWNDCNDIGWDEDSLLLNEISSNDLNQLTINVDVQIFEIIKVHYDDDMQYQRPICFDKPFKKQQFKWKIDGELMKEMKNSYSGKSFQSMIYNQMWCLNVVPNGWRREDHDDIDDDDGDNDDSDDSDDDDDDDVYKDGFRLYLQLCALPPNITGMSAKWSVYGDTIHRNTNKTETFYVGSYKYWAEAAEQDEDGKFDEIILSFNDFQKQETLTFDVDIEILEIYKDDEIGNNIKIKEANWNKYIEENVIEKKEEKKQCDDEYGKNKEFDGEYSWIIKQKLLNEMINADENQEFLSNKFKIGGLDWQIKAYPNGKDYDEGIFYILLELLSLPSSSTDVVVCGRVCCNELSSGWTKVCYYNKENCYHECYDKEKEGISLKEIKEKDLNKLTFVIQIKILKKFSKIEDTIFYRHPIYFKNYKLFKNQQFEWNINELLMEQMKNSNSNKQFESKIFNQMWYVKIIPNSSRVGRVDDDDEKQCVPFVNIELVNYAMPPNIDKISAKWSIYCDPLNINTNQTDDFRFIYNEGCSWNGDFLFDDFKKQDSLTIYVSIEVFDIYIDGGDEINNSEWNKYIMNQPKDIHIKKEKDDQKEVEISSKLMAKNDNVDNVDNVKLDCLSLKFEEMTKAMNEMKGQIKSLIDRDDKRDKEMIKMQKQIKILLGDNDDVDDNEKKEVSNEEKVRIWLDDIVKFPQYADLLINDGYDDLEMIADITLDDLIQIGIDKSGHRKKIIKYAQKLQNVNQGSHSSQAAAAYSQNIIKTEVEGPNVYDTAK